MSPLYQLIIVKVVKYVCCRYCGINDIWSTVDCKSLAYKMHNKNTRNATISMQFIGMAMHNRYQTGYV